MPQGPSMVNRASASHLPVNKLYTAESQKEKEKLNSRQMRAKRKKGSVCVMKGEQM